MYFSLGDVVLVCAKDYVGQDFVRCVYIVGYWCVLERFFDFLCEALPVRFVVVGVCGLVLVKLVVGFSVHCYDDGEVVRGQFVQGGPGSMSVEVVRDRGDVW